MPLVCCWMLDLKNELLAHGDYNVIAVDWSGGNRPLYSKASANARVVGAEIAVLANKLKVNIGRKGIVE